MLELALAPAEASPPVLPAAESEGVEVWRHGDGAVAAYGGRIEDSFWMRLPGVGAFVFGPGEPVLAYAEAGAGTALVEDGFRRTVLPMAVQVLGGEVLHASGVLGSQGAVALCAVSGTGKSTLAYGLGRRGHPLWADDAVAFELEGDAARTTALPFRLQLREPSAAFFGDDTDPEVAKVTEAPLAAICVVERPEAGETALVSLTSAEAFPSVFAHAYCFSLEDPVRKRRMLDTYLRLIEVVPVFRLRVAQGLERLVGALDLLEDRLPGFRT